MQSNRFSGALQATSHRGLQPAMDHIIENDGNPVPDLSTVSASSSGGPSAAAGANEDDEDAEALRAVYGVDGGSQSIDAQAKVRLIVNVFEPDIVRL
jgi:UBX domain-containing protein 1/4